MLDVDQIEATAVALAPPGFLGERGTTMQVDEVDPAGHDGQVLLLRMLSTQAVEDPLHMVDRTEEQGPIDADDAQLRALGQDRLA